MKILVGFKRTIDYRVTARPNKNGTDVDLDGIKMAPNPFDEIALEEALKLKEAGKAEEVIALGIGGDKTPETLRTALAMGADRAIHIPHSGGDIAPFEVAKAFAKVAEKEQAKLVLMGKQAIDNDHGQTPSMLAELLGWPQALNAYALEVNADSAEVTSEIDGGLETFAFKLPAVVSADLRLNTPRFVKMPDIIKARQKPLEEFEHTFGENPVTTEKVYIPPQERKNEILETVDDLIAKLEDIR